MSSDPLPPTVEQIAATPTQFFTWNGYRCAYEVHRPAGEAKQPPLLLIHPIGVGLSRRFWDRFCAAWLAAGQRQTIYSPDLLGCGESEMPHVAYTPEDWAEQLQHFLQTVVKEPVVLVAQGALFPVAIALTQFQTEPNLVKGLILAGPPAWPVMTRETPTWQNKLLWNLFDSPLGNGFFRYARRPQFLRSFSAKQLFDAAEDVDAEWLETLQAGAADAESRHAVFSFLAGFWRKDYGGAIAQIHHPTLVVLGKTASSISQSGKGEQPNERLERYLGALPQGEGLVMGGRNVLPYEVTEEFVKGIVSFVEQLG